ncbi:tautomerase family protein [Shewanella nanhaiensis]|uniref:Tautomerase family protein n=1 Tax=Shewanella nanhaiensis TaxID=2864872 RepID=A0ABS7E1J8_9GAMM|nr:tautomerase family protein [Shewanella nanhaiensis]MBW8183531.1 tautomerase family protein [Shewanella nanhaiensis]
MPHINIKHFPGVTQQQEVNLVKGITALLCDTLHCEAGAVSIAMQAISPEQWQEKVVQKEIEPAAERLVKKPNY